MFVEPLQCKTTDVVIEAFKKIFERTTLRPERIQSDPGGEFKSAKFKKFMKGHGIIYNTTRNPDTKASICERSIRTLKGRITKYLNHINSFRYIDKSDDFVNAYNNSYHRSIRMAPSVVNDCNILQVYKNIRLAQRIPKKKRRAKVKVGDYVRISKEKLIFSKGYDPSWTLEVFRVKTIVKRNPIVYRLIDLQGEEIKGTFYETEVQKIIFDEDAARASVTENPYNFQTFNFNYISFFLDSTPIPSKPFVREQYNSHSIPPRIRLSCSGSNS